MLKLSKEGLEYSFDEGLVDATNRAENNAIMACLRATLESFRNPAFLLARGGKVLSSNGRALSLLADEGAGLFVSASRILTFSNRRVNAEFLDILKEFVEGRALSGRRYVDPSLLLSLRRWCVDLDGAKDQHAVVTFRWAGYECDLDEEELAKVFKLRPMQARLAHALLKGGSLGSFARKAKVSRNTAKYHLNALMPKLECRTQTELIRKMCLLLGG